MYNLLFNIYGEIPLNTPQMNKFTRIFCSFLRFIIRKFQSAFMKFKAGKKLSANDDRVNKNIIVSLTSFPKRLDTLWLTIVSLKNQTVLPCKIVLYLINEEVSRDALPKSLVRELDNIFEIRFRDGKLRAHGKYHFAMKEFPDSCIVTVDDDMIYSYDMVESLWKTHLEYPNCVITNNTFQILTNNGVAIPYLQWKYIYKSDSVINQPNLIPMGVDGALYPPNVLYKDTLNFELAKSLSYLADDLWLYSMASIANTQIVKSAFNSLKIMPVDIADNITLTSVNCGDNQNDTQFLQIREYYKEKLGIDIIR